MKAKQYAQLEAENRVFKNKKPIKNLNCTVLTFLHNSTRKKNQSTHLIRRKIYLGKKLCFANHENYSAISLVTNIPSLISDVKDHKTVRWWKEQ